jgi:hypothetical protein
MDSHATEKKVASYSTLLCVLLRCHTALLQECPLQRFTRTMRSMHTEGKQSCPLLPVRTYTCSRTTAALLIDVQGSVHLCHPCCRQCCVHVQQCRLGAHCVVARIGSCNTAPCSQARMLVFEQAMQQQLGLTLA